VEVADEAIRASVPSKLERGLLTDRVGPRIRLLRNVLMSRITTALAPFGLSPGAFTTMALIAANEGCSQMQISREIGMEKSAVAAVVDELVKRRLVVRDRSAHDRRRNLLSLTPHGERTMHAMHDAAAAEEQAMQSAFTPAEFTQFLRLLDRAYDALSCVGPA
jgi:DNA-binding MarR family transcriptional regulator